MKIIEYCTVSGCNCLDGVINEKIKNGWQPYGILYMGRDTDGDVFWAQAMVRYENEKSNVLSDLRLSSKPQYILHEFFDIPIKYLGMTVRLENCLKSESLDTIGDIVRKPKRNIKQIPNLGNRTFAELQDLLHHYGLTFFMSEADTSTEYFILNDNAKELLYTSKIGPNNFIVNFDDKKITFVSASGGGGGWVVEKEEVLNGNN